MILPDDRPEHDARVLLVITGSRRALGQPLSRNGSLACLEGVVTQVQEIGTHNIFMAEIRNIDVRDEGHGLMHFRRDFALSKPVISPLLQLPDPLFIIRKHNIR